MNSLELYKLAEESGVSVQTHPLPLNESVSFRLEGDYYALIDPAQMETSADERVHLAHELGHCVTGNFYNPYSKLDVREKHEHRANVWAIRQLIPMDNLLQRLQQGLTEAWQLAETFNVPQWFMMQAMEYYRLQAIL